MTKSRYINVVINLRLINKSMMQNRSKYCDYCAIIIENIYKNKDDKQIIIQY